MVSPFLDTLPRTIEQAARDIALRKADAFEPLTADELGLLTLPELVDLSLRAATSADVRESGDDFAHSNGHGPWIAKLRGVSRAANAEIERRADEQPAGLQAAAPDLLAALKDCVEAMHADNPADGWLEIIQRARAAIAKAEQS